MSRDAITIRKLQPEDSLHALTALLHSAYASLAAQGWNFTAADQSVDLTRKRVSAGQCLVAQMDGRLVGTVTVRGPYHPETDAWCLLTPWYQRADTAILSQFAVDPAMQGLGLGGRLMDEAEAWAASQGFSHIALDTAKPAGHLQDRYLKSGYAHAGEVQWDGKTYVSVLMVKPLIERQVA